MSFSFKPLLIPLVSRLPQRGSLRTQLIAWNIAILALLLGGLGVIVRGAVYSALMASVDHDIEEHLRRFHPPPPHRPAPPNGEGAEMPALPPGGEGVPPANGEGFPNAEDMPQPNGEGLPVPGGEGAPLPRAPQNSAPQNSDPYRPLPLDVQGHALERNAAPRHMWDRDAFARALAGQTVWSIVSHGSEPLRVVSRPFPARGAVEGVVQAAYPLGDVYRALHGLDRALLMLIPFALLCAGSVGALLTGRVLRRVRAMTQAAEQIGAQEFARRLPVFGNDEFAHLSTTFNGLLARLESAFMQQEQLLRQQQRLLEQQRRFTADASHELKTPLTIIKGHTSLNLSELANLQQSGTPADRADDSQGDAVREASTSRVNTPSKTDAYFQSFQEIDRAANTMSHLVQDLLLLARSDSGQLARNPILLPLREILERALLAVTMPSASPSDSAAEASPLDAVKMPSVVPVRSRVTLTLADETLCVWGNESELTRLFANLLDNALRYTPANGSVEVSARRENEQVTITITDTGIGIAPEHLPHLGERFYRVDASRTRPTGGMGLGLSICKGIVEAHGGTLAFASAIGKGTTVTVHLPADTPA